MKGFHVNIAVKDLDRSLRFYQDLFAAEPTVAKVDYAKWMLDDPRINFSITQSDSKRGIQHLGLQAESMQELGEIQQRLSAAGQKTVDQAETECCYARSSKTWLRDPDEVSWETFFTHGQITHYGGEFVDAREMLKPPADPVGKRCCA
ncbi:MAG: VOC family protein [Gammaproteobacteria bacterium]|nr:VOC family protein [Gammaproteobacteria bacterium]